MKARGVTERKGIIAWFASNHVAANLLMLLIIFAGLMSAATIRKQTQPDFELNNVQVQVLYLGAAPQEVEEGVEEAVDEAEAAAEDAAEAVEAEAEDAVGEAQAEAEEAVAEMEEMADDVEEAVDEAADSEE